MTREPWLDDPLGYLIGAERIERFSRAAYEREALIVHHNAPSALRADQRSTISIASSRARI
jgi:hypothetical protein